MAIKKISSRVISTIHSAEMKESNNIDWKTRKKIIKPVAVIEYNKYMKDVDRADQYLSYYSILRKTTKWSKKVTVYLFNCTLFNAFVAFNSVQQIKIRYKTFLRQIAYHWVTNETYNIQELRLPIQPTKRSPKFDPLEDYLSI